MNDMSIQELEHTLHAGEREVLDASTLATIRRLGSRRRTTRRALTAVGAAVVVGAVGLTLALGSTGPEGTRDDSLYAADPPPAELSHLASRALQEIPGAVQVSEWQVVVPAPDAKSQYWHDNPDESVVGEPVALNAKSYHGVTMYPENAWPAWLYDGTLDYEQSQEEDGSFPVGSTGTGILVESGDAMLGCVSLKDKPCGPALLTRTADGKLHHEWGMGTDDFLKPGSEMEVFLEEDYSTGAPGTLAFAGLPGTDVARVDFVTTSGQVFEGRVHSGLVEGASMMSALVPGELAKVIAYDAEGDVIEDHPLKACDTPVECEVR